MTMGSSVFRLSSTSRHSTFKLALSRELASQREGEASCLVSKSAAAAAAKVLRWSSRRLYPNFKRYIKEVHSWCAYLYHYFFCWRIPCLKTKQRKGDVFTCVFFDHHSCMIEGRRSIKINSKGVMYEAYLFHDAEDTYYDLTLSRLKYVLIASWENNLNETSIFKPLVKTWCHFLSWWFEMHFYCDCQNR